MQELEPEYLSELARQFSFLSAFLGGFAATFMGTLINTSPERKIGRWSIVCAAFAAVAFVVAVIASTMLIVALHPDAPVGMAPAASILRARLTAGVAFGLGVYSLLFAIGLSGWLHSRFTGIMTTAISGIGAVLVSWAIAGF